MSALPVPAEAEGPVVRARGVTKVYGGTTALDGVDFEVHPGAVNALILEESLIHSHDKRHVHAGCLPV